MVVIILCVKFIKGRCRKVYLGHCSVCDLSFTEGNIKDHILKIHHMHPVVVCPRCGSLTWLGAEYQIRKSKLINSLDHKDAEFDKLED